MHNPTTALEVTNNLFSLSRTRDKRASIHRYRTISPKIDASFELISCTKILINRFEEILRTDLGPGHRTIILS